MAFIKKFVSLVFEPISAKQVSYIRICIYGSKMTKFVKYSQKWLKCAHVSYAYLESCTKRLQPKFWVQRGAHSLLVIEMKNKEPSSKKDLGSDSGQVWRSSNKFSLSQIPAPPTS